MKDTFNFMHPVRAISPASVADNTAFVGSIVNRMVAVGFAALTYLIIWGALADADATFTVLLEHGDLADGSDMAAVPDAMLIGTEALAGATFAGDNTVTKLGYTGGKQYTRLTVTPANNAGSATVSAIAVLGEAQATPTVNPPSAA